MSADDWVIPCAVGWVFNEKVRGARVERVNKSERNG